MAKPSHPPFLRHPENGRLFPYTEGLAARGDMIAEWDATLDPDAAPVPVANEADADPDGDIFDNMDKEELKAYLASAGIKFHPSSGAPKLRELARTEGGE